MGRETVLLRSKEKKERGEVAAFLRALADKVDDGRVVLQQAGQEVALDVPGRVEMQVKAEEEEKGTRTQLGIEVEFQWYVGEDASSGGVTLG